MCVTKLIQNESTVTLSELTIVVELNDFDGLLRATFQNEFLKW